MKFIGRILAVLALASVTTTSFAAVRGFHARLGNFTSGPAAVFLPLNALGATVVGFNLPPGGGGKKVLTFSFECAVSEAAGNTSAWLDIDIIVNGVTVPVTVGAADAFCTSDGIVGFGHWTHPSISVLVNGFPGLNSVRILARGNNGATGIWVGDSALIIHD
jgi:hypothetical protein